MNKMMLVKIGFAESLPFLKLIVKLTSHVISVSTNTICITFT